MLQKLQPSVVISLAQTVSYHRHSHHQIVISLSGQSEFNIDGVTNLIYPGLGCLVMANCEHTFVGVGDNELLVINLPLGFSDNNEIEQRTTQLFAHSGYFNLDNQSQQLIQLLAFEIKANPDDELLQQACTMTLLCVLQRHFKIPHSASSSQRIDIDAIDDFIQRNINHKISVSQLAAIAFLSESQFYALFKAQTALTPQRYILQKRLQLAKQLLQESQLTLADIAQICGFAGQSSFSQAFRRLCGISPARYQRQL
ncbi:HTH-type transcriptional activator RhaS [Photobacterium malacitanum]|uniref:HTH-type transcriptional activator RhaS n=2 Tax=Photobacterium malacitanum TaxID=2204294 RepID=A0A1Y6ME92_9GAMM|nr:HTH-type transcriptional activator RhaS [Photobacterium malacitanum]